MKTKIIFISLLLITLVGCSTGINNNYSNFAQCLAEKNLTFYGAFWCPHCAEQKKMFGEAIKDLPYVECSLPDKSGQTQICKDAGIEAYPTWQFSDGSRTVGVVAIEDLSRKSGCSLQ